jgi:hypothetical protein
LNLFLKRVNPELFMEGFIQRLYDVMGFIFEGLREGFGKGVLSRKKGRIVHLVIQRL